jgi:hypothetical protein
LRRNDTYPLVRDTKSSPKPARKFDISLANFRQPFQLSDVQTTHGSCRSFGESGFFAATHREPDDGLNRGRYRNISVVIPRERSAPKSITDLPEPDFWTG